MRSNGGEAPGSGMQAQGDPGERGEGRRWGGMGGRVVAMTAGTRRMGHRTWWKQKVVWN